MTQRLKAKHAEGKPVVKHREFVPGVDLRLEYMAYMRRKAKDVEGQPVVKQSNPQSKKKKLPLRPLSDFQKVPMPSWPPSDSMTQSDASGLRNPTQSKANEAKGKPSVNKMKRWVPVERIYPLMIVASAQSSQKHLSGSINESVIQLRVLRVCAWVACSPCDVLFMLQIRVQITHHR